MTPWFSWRILTASLIHRVVLSDSRAMTLLPRPSWWRDFLCWRGPWNVNNLCVIITVVICSKFVSSVFVSTDVFLQENGLGAYCRQWWNCWDMTWRSAVPRVWRCRRPSRRECEAEWRVPTETRQRRRVTRFLSATRWHLHITNFHRSAAQHSTVLFQCGLLSRGSMLK